MKRLLHPAWVIALLLAAALLMASGAIGGAGTHEVPASSAPLETRVDEAGPREATQPCPAPLRAGARDA